LRRTRRPCLSGSESPPPAPALARAARGRPRSRLSRAAREASPRTRPGRSGGRTRDPRRSFAAHRRHAQGWQHLFELLSLRLEPGRKPQLLSEAFGLLIRAEAGRVGGDLEKDAAGLPEAQSAGHQLRSGHRIGREEGDVVEAPDGVLWRNAAVCPTLAAVLWAGDELEPQAVRIGAAEHRLPEAVLGFLEAHPGFHEPLRPV